MTVPGVPFDDDEHDPSYISAYDLAGCYVGGCYLPLMSTTFMICPTSEDTYNAGGCSNLGPVPCPWSFPYERRPGTNSFKRSDNPDEDMGEFQNSCCMMHKIWWACKCLPFGCCSPQAPSYPQAPGLVTAVAPSGPQISVTATINGADPTQISIYQKDSVGVAKLRLHQASAADNGKQFGRVLPPPASFRLSFGGISLEDSDTFENHDVQEDAHFNLLFEEGFQIDLAHSKKNGETESVKLTVWPEEVLADGIARALRAKGVPEARLSRLMYDVNHRWRISGHDQDELALDLTFKDAGLSAGDTIAVVYSNSQELISTEDIAGCWFCICFPFMCTACFHKEANGENGLVHSGCLMCLIPFREERHRVEGTNGFCNDDPNNIDHYAAPSFVTNGPSFSMRICPASK